MGMVLDAEGLDGSEKLLLIGYTNWTDPYGYCWPSEQRLADSCGTSRSTVQRVKRKLIKRKLLKSVRRVNSKGEPISNLSRVNLPMLASMARKRTAYDDNLIDAITFDDDTQGDPEATLRGTPDDPETPSDLLTHQSDSYPESNRLLPRVKMTPTPSQIDSQSRSYPEEIPLSHPSVRTRAAVGAAAGVEREKIAPLKRRTSPAPSAKGGVMADATPLRQQAAEPEPAGAEVPGQREGSDKDAAAAGARIVLAYVTALGKSVDNGTRARLQGQAVELLGRGLPEAWLCEQVRVMAANGWKDLLMHVDHPKVTPPSPSLETRGVPEWCGKCAGGRDWSGEPVNPAAQFNPRFRVLDGEKCPDCHPERVSASV